MGLLDFSEFETSQGGTWRIAGCRDWFSKCEHPFARLAECEPIRRIFNAIELALADHSAVFARRLLEAVDPDTGELGPAGRIVTDNGGPFRSLNFELFIMQHPELRHVHARVKSPCQNGSRERGFGTLKKRRVLPRRASATHKSVVERAEDYRVEYNTQRPHEAIAFNRPLDVHLGRARATIPTFEQEEILPTT